MGRFISWLLDLLVIWLIVRAVSRALGFGQRPKAVPRQRASAKPLERAGGTLVRDPECGTYIPASRALRVGSGDQVQYFCSTACRDTFAGRQAKRA